MTWFLYRGFETAWSCIEGLKWLGVCIVVLKWLGELYRGPAMTWNCMVGLKWLDFFMGVWNDLIFVWGFDITWICTGGLEWRGFCMVGWQWLGFCIVGLEMTRFLLEGSEMTWNCIGGLTRLDFCIVLLRCWCASQENVSTCSWGKHAVICLWIASYKAFSIRYDTNRNNTHQTTAVSYRWIPRTWWMLNRDHRICVFFSFFFHPPADGGKKSFSSQHFHYDTWVVCVFSWGIPQLQSDWSLSCDHGLECAS